MSLLPFLENVLELVFGQEGIDYQHARIDRAGRILLIFEI